MFIDLSDRSIVRRRLNSAKEASLRENREEKSSVASSSTAILSILFHITVIEYGHEHLISTVVYPLSGHWFANRWGIWLLVNHVRLQAFTPRL
ncbi:hypothetical protein J6590_012430 [Homalodisca vitripennis]|nr:hypothetical protein J6590_012430 [Homalodisca vitripennis]